MRAAKDALLEGVIIHGQRIIGRAKTDLTAEGKMGRMLPIGRWRSHVEECVHGIIYAAYGREMPSAIASTPTTTPRRVFVKSGRVLTTSPGLSLNRTSAQHTKAITKPNT